MAVTRFGLGGSSAAYAGFTSKLAVVPLVVAHWQVNTGAVLPLIAVNTGAVLAVIQVNTGAVLPTISVNTGAVHPVIDVNTGGISVGS